ncbi:F-box protein At5g49610-like [Salvia hispanica]|uniref:F-box protein At5g49610-like n=1 Tax=Salvia hispanica TaxID=49212 RepID=UPI002009A090|nr:F-box protein At5g49610-like [Salvia hispanica]
MGLDCLTLNHVLGFMNRASPLVSAIFVFSCRAKATGLQMTFVGMAKHIAMNNDVLSEILLCLPVPSLLRFRAVCKTWGNIIDSQPFQKLHTHNNDKSDDMVHLQLTHSNEQDKLCLQVTFPNLVNRVQKELSIKLQCDRKSLMLVDAVKGLICINPTMFQVPVAICNPFLGKLKLLPLKASSPSKCSYTMYRRKVAIGFDEDYKVVQLLSCGQHRYFHAQVFSKSTDSWRELADIVIEDLAIDLVVPIKSGCKNGYFVHWYAYLRKVGGDVERKILSFDMKNEVFREITLPVGYPYIHLVIVRGKALRVHTVSHIFAEDEHSFRLFDFLTCGSDNLVKIYESRCAGSELSWKHVMNVRVPLSGSEVPLCRTCCVFFMHQSGVFVYDYSARKFICKHSVSEVICMDEIVEYRGSFISV